MFQPKSSVDSDRARKADFVHEAVKYEGASRAKLIILSTCAHCGVYIGASSNPQLLQRVEGLHRCSQAKSPGAAA